MSARAARFAALALLGLALGACRSQPLAKAGRELKLEVDPPSPGELAGGTVVRVRARPLPPTELAWVSGTVALFGAPTVVFKPEAQGGGWVFATAVPPMVEVPAGSYRIKAWGPTRLGEMYGGELIYEVR